jgi:hypothetical protein
VQQIPKMSHQSLAVGCEKPHAILSKCRMTPIFRFKCILEQSAPDFLLAQVQKFHETDVLEHGVVEGLGVMVGCEG